MWLSELSASFVRMYSSVQMNPTIRFICFPRIWVWKARMHVKDLAVNGNDLMALGLSGREIGAELNRLLELVLDEQLPNEKLSLLAAVRPS